MLKHRVASGCLIGIAVIAAAYWLPPIGVWVLLVAMSAVAQREFYAMIDAGGIPVFRVLGLLCGTALISATFWTLGPSPDQMAKAYEWEHAVLLVCLVAVFIRQFPQRHNAQPLATIGCTLLGIWYVPYLFNFFTRLAFQWDGGDDGRSMGAVGATGRTLVMYLVVVVKSTDIGAYVVGRLIGRHKLFPRISPGKTWEGLLGGVFLAVVVSLLFCRVGHGYLGTVRLGYAHAVALGGLLAVVGVVGDLFESLLKRATGLKDSGRLIPGMGGWLDVVDSLLFGAPVLYVYARLMMP